MVSLFISDSNVYNELRRIGINNNVLLQRPAAITQLDLLIPKSAPAQKQPESKPT